MNPLCHEWKVLVVILESTKVHEEMCNTGILSSATPSNTLRLNFYGGTFFFYYYGIWWSAYAASCLVVNVLNPYLPHCFSEQRL